MKPHVGRHIMFAFLRQAARLARKLDIPLKEFQELTGAAYFSEFLQHSATQKVVATRMGISVRKAASMAASLRESFMKVDDEAGLPRRIEHLLWAKPVSRARVTQMMPDGSERVGHAVEKLIKEGRVVEDTESRTPVLSVTRGHVRLVQDDWLSRLDGVENLLRNVGDTIENRFWGDSSFSMARTISVGIRPSDIAQLNQLYEEHIWPFLIALEESSKGKEEVIEINLSLIWAKSTSTRKNK